MREDDNEGSEGEGKSLAQESLCWKEEKRGQRLSDVDGQGEGVRERYKIRLERVDHFL